LIGALIPEHWPQVRDIYAAGIATGDATFQSEPPTWDEWDRGHLAEHRFVELDGARVLGWVAASPTSSRPVYAGVVEESVYIAPSAQGRGVARQLLTALIESTEHAGIWTIETGIFPENVASLAVHERVGFRRVGVRERLGRHHDRWRDVVLLERRSALISLTNQDN
jgi:L-amino acid N-acyltransferase YncA